MIPSLSYDAHRRRLFFWFEGTALLFGGGCAFLAASIVAQPGNSWGGERGILAFSASIAAAITAWGLWRYCAARSQWISVRRAIGAGMLFSILAHPLAWYLTMCISFFAHLLNPSVLSGSLDVDPISAFLGSIFLAQVSLLLVGWLTLPVGAMMARWLVLMLRRQQHI